MLNERLEALKYKTDKTLQDLFDIAWERAKIQVKSENTDPRGAIYNTCLYRGPGGGCFIGWAIPDEWYNAEIEGCSVENPPVCEAAGISDDVEPYALIKLQQIHDAYKPEKWREHLISYASERNLKIPDEVTADVR